MNKESEKAGLKLNIQKTKIMAYLPIISRKVDRETMEAITYFILGGGTKITVDNDCSFEIKRHFFLGRKTITNLDNILKQRHCFPNKSLYSKAIYFLYFLSNSHVQM